MSKADIGPKIGLEGDKEFRSSLKDINAGLKTLASEAKMVESSFTKETTAEEKAAKMADVLNKQIEKQKEKLALCQDQLEKASSKYKEGDSRLEEYKKKVYDAQTELNKMETKLKENTSATDKLSKEEQTASKDTEHLKGATKDASAAMGEAEKQTKSWGDVMKGSLAAEAIKAGLSKLVDLAKQAATALKDCAESGAVYGDEMITMSQTTGVSTKTLQQYKYMSGLVDVSLETISGSLTKVQKSMISAQKGTGDAHDAYKELGVSITDANGNLRDSEDVFNDLIDALGKVDNETKRDTMAMTLMGKSAKELNPLIAVGSQKLDEYRQEAEDVGYVLSNQELKALQKARDAMDRLDNATESCKNQFAIGLAPALETSEQLLADKLNSPKVQNAIEHLSEGLGETIVKAAEFASDAIDALISVVDLFNGEIDSMSDSEYKLIRSTETLSDEVADMHDSYDTGAHAVIEEQERVEDLWKELQNLISKTGDLTEEEQAHGDYLTQSLNDALGTEYQWADLLAGKYGDLTGEIENLIQKKTALALLDKNQEMYTAAVTKIDSARQEAAQLKIDYDAKMQAYTWAAEVRDAMEAEYDKIPFWDLGKKIEMGSALTEQRAKVNGFASDAIELHNALETAQKTEEDLTRVIYTQEAAQEALFKGEYDTAVDLLTGLSSAQEDYSTKRGTITAKETEELREQYKIQSEIVDSYTEHMKAGDAGYTQAQLAEYQTRQAELGRMLDNIDSGMTRWDDIMESSRINQERSMGQIGIAAEGMETDVTSATGGAATATEIFAATARSAGDEAGFAFDGARTHMSETMEGMKSDISGQVDPFYWQAYELGKNAALGASKGLSDFASSVVNGMKSMIHAACLAANQEAQINSPSKVTQKTGAGLGEGLVVGMDKERSEIEKAAQRMADAAMSGTYDNGWTTSTYGSVYSNAYTTNLGGITLNVSGAGVANVDQLADRVAAKLTQQVRIAQRAR